MPRLTELSRSIAGKVAVVTGAASGMGRATAHLFSDEGAKVAVLDVNADGAGSVVAEIEAAGGTARGWQVDIGDADAVGKAVGQVTGHFGGVDILVNNAGVSVPVAFADDAWEETWARTQAVNLTGQARMIRACLPHLQASGAGRIVNIASTEGLGASILQSPYTASKHGVIGLTRSLAVELGRTGVTVNCICPGPIHTGLTQPIPDEAKQAFARSRVPIGRYGEAEEVAHMTLSLCLPAASYCTGAVLVVDGGMLTQNM